MCRSIKRKLLTFIHLHPNGQIHIMEHYLEFRFNLLEIRACFLYLDVEFKALVVSHLSSSHVREILIRKCGTNKTKGREDRIDIQWPRKLLVSLGLTPGDLHECFSRFPLLIYTFAVHNLYNQ